MDRLSELLELARGRAAKLSAPYAGAFTPAEAHEVLQLLPEAKLVDVRTRAEWDWVGRVPGAIEIELMSYPGNALNALFGHAIEAAAGNKDTPLLFLCRSGGRSHNAATALAAAGFTRCYNVLEGFEGDKDASGRRNTVGGWRAAGLPWQQS